ncbi:TPA: hypothetical protein JGU28_004676 [Salmonella enterica]|nr:hypothetical protein [Salmonella enterica]
MAETDHNMNLYSDIYHSVMAGSLVNLNFSEMERDERLQLAICCDEARAGLCHCLDFIGNILTTFAQQNTCALTRQDISHLGHTLTTASQLIPALNNLYLFLHADLEQNNVGGDK